MRALRAFEIAMRRGQVAVRLRCRKSGRVRLLAFTIDDLLRLGWSGAIAQVEALLTTARLSNMEAELT